MKVLRTVLAFIVCTSPALAFDSPKALQDAFLAALHAEDADSIAACYTADAMNFTPDMLVGYGPDAARQSWGGFFEAFDIVSVELSEKHMVESGDLAAAWGLYTMTVTPAAGGEPIVMQGRYMDVSRRIDGKWLYVADHASVPLPPPAE